MKIGTILLIAISAAWGQAPPSATWKEFSIGPPTRNQSGFNRDGVRAQGVPLKRLVARAYGLPEERIMGPVWLADDRYAITALVNNPDDFQPLLQRELTTRFQMAAHKETREMPALILRADPGAPKPPSSGGSGRDAEISRRGVKASGATMHEFAGMLADAMQRPAFDETGIEGRFDFALSWNPGDVASLQAAVKDQLDMRLVEEKRKVEILIVDKIEKLHFDK